MRTLRRLSMVLVVVLTLSMTAFAGITDTPPAPQPSPDPIGATAPVSGDQSDQTVSTSASDSLADIALTLVQTALSLF
jgi:hypothetical protein